MIPTLNMYAPRSYLMFASYAEANHGHNVLEEVKVEVPIFDPLGPIEYCKCRGAGSESGVVQLPPNRK